MRAAEIRSTFLEFFQGKEHRLVSSGPVAPNDDPTLMFANAGMNQFKGVFTGHETRDYVRAASTQKCIRAGGKHNDLENVGYTARHLTFFEMLGNFSFGDYFKEEICAWAWELVTSGYGLDPSQLWVTVFAEDEEARAIWRDQVGVAPDRIVSMGEKDNYWAMGDVGPCGPCSEIFYDRGADHSCGPDCGIDRCDCDRYLEFWNLVFMQFEQLEDGSKVPLPRPSIDTGMGLERMAMILQDKATVFETDVLAGLAEETARLTGQPVDSGPSGTPHRVISDHMRSLCFAIADGAFPSNEGRGYVLRRILRRAARYGYKLGMEKPFLHQLVSPLAESMSGAFPELEQSRTVIEGRILAEEESFGRTLRKGMQSFDQEVDAMARDKRRVFSGATAFFLHDTCGFPFDLTEQMARERELEIDGAEFDHLMGEQQQRSRSERSAASLTSDLDGQDPFAATAATEFTGYHCFEGRAQLLACDGDADDLRVVLSSTPFYGEGGGEVGDSGQIVGADFEMDVHDTRKNDRGVFIHQGRLRRGDLADVIVGSEVEASLDVDRRLAIHRNHTATHLLHAALRDVLGSHVQQKGSLVEPDRLRFDLSHFQKVEPAELEAIERQVQEQILLDSELQIGVYNRDEAIERGAMAFFGEKYGNKVRVVEVPGYSLELCGGAHVTRTGEIGGFLIVSEGSVSSGVRRIEAVTGVGALRRSRDGEEIIRQVAATLRVSREDIVTRLAGLLQENKQLKSGKKSEGSSDLPAILERDGVKSEAAGHEILVATFPPTQSEALLELADSLKRRKGKRVFVLATTGDDNVRFVVGKSQEVAKGTVHCGQIAKLGAKHLGGGGGGRPDLAQAGGKDIAKLPEALDLMAEEIRKSIQD